jgi:hypothetical protein
MSQRNQIEKTPEKFYTRGLEPILNEKAKQGVNFIQDYLKKTKNPFIPKNKLGKELKNNPEIKEFSELEFNYLLEYMEDYEYVVQDYETKTGFLRKPSGNYADINRGRKEFIKRKIESREKFLSRNPLVFD